MPTGEDLGTQRLPSEELAPARPCPYCARAVRDGEEGPGDGILGVTVCVCAACGRSTSKPTWTPASTRRALLLAVRTLGPPCLRPADPERPARL
jgi:hypothetical protein